MTIDDKVLTACIQWHKIALSFELEPINRQLTEATITILERVKRLDELLGHPSFDYSLVVVRECLHGDDTRLRDLVGENDA